MVILTQNQKEMAIRRRFEAYRVDPVGFMTDILDVNPSHVWPKMREIAESVRDHRYTAVPAGHSVSKTYTAARLAVWFKACFQPSTVVTTAPSDNQVRNQLWREIHAAFAYASGHVPLGGAMRVLQWDMIPSKQTLSQIPPGQRSLWEKNFIIGFATSPDNVGEHATKMQGFHNEHVLVILDEACGIVSPIWRAVLESLMTDENCRILAIGNPTEPFGDFANACKSDRWNTVKVSVRDTPNFISRSRIIPQVAGYDYDQDIVAEYGEFSNKHKYRCLGEFPSYSEGTFYGAELAKARFDGRVGVWDHEPTQVVYTFADFGDMYTAFIFMQLLRSRIRIIDCYWDNKGVGMAAYAKVIQSKDYVYDTGPGPKSSPRIYCGPDLITSNERSVQTGKATRDIGAELGLNLTAVRAHYFGDGIEAVRSIWPLMEINEPLCKIFLDAVQGYRKKKDIVQSTDKQPVYHDVPVPRSWERHMMDALRHLAVAYRYVLKQRGKLIGFQKPISTQRAFNRNSGYGRRHVFDFHRGRAQRRSVIPRRYL